MTALDVAISRPQGGADCGIERVVADQLSDFVAIKFVTHTRHRISEDKFHVVFGEFSQHLFDGERTGEVDIGDGPRVEHDERSEEHTSDWSSDVCSSDLSSAATGDITGR